MKQNFDIGKITNDVTEVLRYSQDFGDDLPGVPAIIQDWLENKKFFIDKMDGNLVCQLNDPVSFELDEKAKLDKLERFANQVSEHYNNFQLSEFLQNISVDDFYNNITSKEYVIYGNNKIVVPKNYKTVKAFKFFEKNIDLLKQLQSEASRIIQENVVSGYLCFSVHPLDYLSSSENAHNWRSCHALDGEYRSGNLNYMVDGTTVVCYLRAEKQAILPHFPEGIPWNSKKWRVLLFFSGDRTMVFAGRQYPFTANNGIDIIREKILPIIGLGTWTKWKNTLLHSYKDELSGDDFFFTKMIPVGDTLKPIKDVVINGDSTYHFNDLLRSSCYSPMWAYKERKYYWDTENTGCSSNSTKVEVGKSCICPVCGQGIVSFTESMTCPRCADIYGYENGDYYECEICGSMTHCDDMYDLEFSGMHVCPECYARETAQCQECGTRDLPDVVKYHDGDTRCLCPACWEDSQRKPPPKIVLF